MNRFCPVKKVLLGDRNLVRNLKGKVDKNNFVTTQFDPATKTTFVPNRFQRGPRPNRPAYSHNTASIVPKVANSDPKVANSDPTETRTNVQYPRPVRQYVKVHEKTPSFYQVPKLRNLNFCCYTLGFWGMFGRIRGDVRD